MGGNWKCNGSLTSVRKLLDDLNALLVDQARTTTVAIFPSLLHLPLVQSHLGSVEQDDGVAVHVEVGAQNCNFQGQGAFTGEVSPDMLNDLEIPNVIVGHSERRHIFHESDEVVSKKIHAAQNNGLRVVACIGETLEQRESNQTMSVIDVQLDHVRKGVLDWSKIVIAYEPVWAIGTGKTATPEQAQEVHKGIRSWIRSTISEDVAAAVRIIYGGSVNGKNADDLAKMPDIDGFLVGGASLKPEFVAIVNAAEQAYHAKVAGPK